MKLCPTTEVLTSIAALDQRMIEKRIILPLENSYNESEYQNGFACQDWKLRRL